MPSITLKEEIANEQSQLPPSYIDQLLKDLTDPYPVWSMVLPLDPSELFSIPAMMLISLNNLIPGDTCNNDINNTQNNKKGDKPLSADEVQSLQQFIFSNITIIEYTTRLKQLIYTGKFPNLAFLTLDLTRGHIQSPQRPANQQIYDVLQFQEYLPKMIGLKSLKIVIEDMEKRTKDRVSWNPFSSLTVTHFPSLESLEFAYIFRPDEDLDSFNILSCFFKNCTFPSLKTISIASNFLSSEDPSQIKQLIGYILAVSKLSGFSIDQDILLSPSQQFYEELSQTFELQSKLLNLSFNSFLPIPIRHKILKSPHLTSLKSLNLDKAFKDQFDFDESSEWLFKMEWMSNINKLTLGDHCPISPRSAINIAKSPYLINLIDLAFPSREWRLGNYESSPDVLKGIGIILKSPNLFKLKTMELSSPTDEHISIITSSPYLTNLEVLTIRSPPTSLFLSIASSQTLTNLYKLQCHLDHVSSDGFYESPLVSDGLVAFFQSPNIQHLTSLDAINLTQIDVRVLESLLSSSYVSNIEELYIGGRNDDNTTSTRLKELFFSNPAWSNLTSISLPNFDDNDAEAMVQSPYLSKIEFISVYGSNLSPQGFALLKANNIKIDEEEAILFYDYDDYDDYDDNDDND